DGLAGRVVENTVRLVPPTALLAERVVDEPRGLAGRDGVRRQDLIHGGRGRVGLALRYTRGSLAVAGLGRCELVEERTLCLVQTEHVVLLVLAELVARLAAREEPAGCEVVPRAAVSQRLLALESAHEGGT